jgi:hypothetical protein
MSNEEKVTPPETERKNYKNVENKKEKEEEEGDAEPKRKSKRSLSKADDAFIGVNILFSNHVGKAMTDSKGVISFKAGGNKIFLDGTF